MKVINMADLRKGENKTIHLSDAKFFNEPQIKFQTSAGQSEIQYDFQGRNTSADARNETYTRSQKFFDETPTVPIHKTQLHNDKS